METSAKNSTNVEQAFMKMATEIKLRIGSIQAPNKPSSAIRPNNDGGRPVEQKGGCC